MFWSTLLIVSLLTVSDVTSSILWPKDDATAATINVALVRSNAADNSGV